MFDQLLESGHRGINRSPWGLGAAVALHVMLLTLAWPRAKPVAASPPTWVEWPALLPPLRGPVDGSGSPLGVTIDPDISIAAPAIPDIPLAILQSRIVLDSGVFGQRQEKATPESEPDVYPLSQVQDLPELLTARTPSYPEALRRAGVEGEVIVAVVVDTVGRTEPGSARIVRSDDRGFDQAALAMVRDARFRPARVLGCGVRVLVWMPVRFRLEHESF